MENIFIIIATPRIEAQQYHLADSPISGVVGLFTTQLAPDCSIPSWRRVFQLFLGCLLRGSGGGVSYEKVKFNLVQNKYVLSRFSGVGVTTRARKM